MSDDRDALPSCLMLSLSKHEASGTAVGPVLSFDKLRMRAYCDHTLSEAER